MRTVYIIGGIILLNVVLSLTTAVPEVTSAATGLDLWVDRNSLGGACSDTRARADVSAATPWCTLAAAGNNVLPGDTVHVRQGDYTEIHTCFICNDNAVLQLVVSGTSDAWIRFQAVAGETVRITGVGGATHGVQVIETWDDSVQPRYVALTGFEIGDVPGNCVTVKDTSDVMLNDLELTGCGRGAVELHRTTRVTVENSHIHDNLMDGWTSAIDLYECLDGNVVRGNRIWGNTDEDPRDSEGHGITMDYCLGNGGALIENNVIWDNEGWCMAIYFSDGAIIRNNTCWMNGNPRPDTGELSILGRNHRIHNNILLPRNGRIALNLRERNPEYLGHLDTIQSDSNLMWAATHENVMQWSLGTIGTVAEYRTQNAAYGWGIHALQVDPLLTAPASQNFGLQSGSPAIDSGDNSNAPTTDHVGNPRPWDGNGDNTAIVDRGSYEYFTFAPSDFIYLPLLLR